MPPRRRDPEALLRRRASQGDPPWTSSTKPPPTPAQARAHQRERDWASALPGPARSLTDHAFNAPAAFTAPSDELAALAEQTARSLEPGDLRRLVELCGQSAPGAAALICAARDLRRNAFDIPTLTRRVSDAETILAAAGSFIRGARLSRAQLADLHRQRADAPSAPAEMLTGALDIQASTHPAIRYLHRAWAEHIAEHGPSQPEGPRAARRLDDHVLMAAIKHADHAQAAVIDDVCAQITELLHGQIGRPTLRWWRWRRELRSRTRTNVIVHRPFVDAAGTPKRMKLTRADRRLIARHVRLTGMPADILGDAVRRVVFTHLAAKPNRGGDSLTEALAEIVADSVRLHIELDSLLDRPSRRARPWHRRVIFPLGKI